MAKRSLLSRCPSYVDPYVNVSVIHVGFEFSRQIFEQRVSLKSLQFGAEFFHADRWTGGHDEPNSCNFANAPNKTIGR